MQWAEAFLDELEKLSKLNPDVQLRPHQRQAVQMLERSGNRALFAHGTGTGKTLSAIAGFEHLKEQGKAEKALVITPASLQTNFSEKGVRKFTDSTVGPVGSGSHYQLMTLEKFRKNPAKALEDSGADTMIIDEIHRAKDPGSKSYKALREAATGTQVKNVIGLTGSFISNHPSEVVPLMDIVRPDHQLGSTTGFKRRYTTSEETGGGFLIGPRKRTTLKNEPKLQKMVGPGLHYVGHDELQGLPKMRLKDVHVQMSADQKKTYDFALGGLSPAEREKIRQGLPPSQTEAQHIFAKITRARQASNSLGTHLQMKAADSAEKTPKLKKIMDDVEDHLKKTPDGQAVIYSNFVKGGAIELYHGLKQRGHDPGIYAGEGAFKDVDKKARDQHVNDFLAGKRKIMILTPAGGEGVSLNNATFMAMADHFYNPEKNWQAVARGRRLGGLAHRRPEDRQLEVRRYYSDPKQGLFGRIFNKEVGVDEWIQRVADEKDRLNNEMKSTVRTGRKNP